VKNCRRVQKYEIASLTINVMRSDTDPALFKAASICLRSCMRPSITAAA